MPSMTPNPRARVQAERSIPDADMAASRPKDAPEGVAAVLTSPCAPGSLTAVQRAPSGFPTHRHVADLIRVDGVSRWAWLIPLAEQRALTGRGLRSERAADGTVRLMARVDGEERR